MSFQPEILSFLMGYICGALILLIFMVSDNIEKVWRRNNE